MEDTLSNYEIDERERKESQKQRAQRSHGLDERYSSREGFGRDDQKNIKNILRTVPKSPSPLEKEEVTNPKYYNERKLEPLDYIIANELDFLEGNIIKYVTRYTYKGGVNDLLKARTYLEKLIERERNGR